MRGMGDSTLVSDGNDISADGRRRAGGHGRIGPERIGVSVGHVRGRPEMEIRAGWRENRARHGFHPGGVDQRLQSRRQDEGYGLVRLARHFGQLHLISRSPNSCYTESTAEAQWFGGEAGGHLRISSPFFWLWGTRTVRWRAVGHFRWSPERLEEFLLRPFDRGIGELMRGLGSGFRIAVPGSMSGDAFSVRLVLTYELTRVMPRFADVPWSDDGRHAGPWNQATLKAL